jgi:mannan endo-1,4-beta-mannosidase
MLKSLLLPLLAFCIITSPAAALVDPDATQGTKDLYALIQQLNSADGAAFGNQYDVYCGMYADGTTWTYAGGDTLNSDIKNICGILPSVAGWDLSEYALTTTAGIDSVIKADAMGIICCLSFHEPNPSTGGSYKDTTMDLADILPGGDDHDAFVAQWAGAADKIRQMKRADGSPVPIVLRPFHELSGNWFWWGSDTDKTEFIALWQWLVTYLRDTQGLHNILYVYNTDKISTKAQYLDRWPGDDYVDIVSCDVYMADSSTASTLTVPLGIVIGVSQEKGKPAALAETGGSNNGMGGSTLDAWWTTKVLKPLQDAGMFNKIAYIAGWANWGTSQYHIPYPGSSKAADFATFLNSDNIFLLDDLNVDASWTEITHMGMTYTNFYPWIYSRNQGWEYMLSLFNSKNTNDWYYDMDLGWLWTSKRNYPIFWSQNAGWLYYSNTTSQGVRWFYSYADAKWVSYQLSD